MECPACEGAGCDECNDGYFEIPGCPQSYIRSLLTPIRLADLFEKGMLPVSGGVIDQAASFIEFASQWKTEVRATENDG